MKKIITILILGIFLLTGLNNVSAVLIHKSKTSSIKDNDIRYVGINSNKYYAVIVCGGPTEAIHETAAIHAKNVFLSMGYKVNYLKEPSKSEAESAITEWIPENLGGTRKVALIFINHGTNSGFCLNKEGYIGLSSGIMSHSDLTTWLNEIELIYSKCVIVIQVCHSGLFIPSLSKTNRIIMTSANYGVSWKGQKYFIETFLDSLEEGKSYGRAWIDADKTVAHYHIQNPQIDDNGDGMLHGNLFIADDLLIGGDGNLALSTYPYARVKTSFLQAIARILKNFSESFPIHPQLLKL